jgi:hypothetical protein
VAYGAISRLPARGVVGWVGRRWWEGGCSLACSVLALALGALAAQGCGSDPSYIPCGGPGSGLECPDGLICVNDGRNCVEPDAGSDGGDGGP